MCVCVYVVWNTSHVTHARMLFFSVKSVQGLYFEVVHMQIKPRGKYLITEIDGIVYSTDDIFWADFSTDIHPIYSKPEYTKEYYGLKREKWFYNPKLGNILTDVEATKESWKKGLKQEQQRYDDGFVYKKGRWIKEGE